MTRVLIVDDHPLVRYALRAVLEQESDLDVVGEASTGSQALDACKRLAPDVMLLDLRLPDGSGVDVCGTLKRAHSQTRVLCLTSYDDDEEVYGALDAGAAGYLMKDVAPAALVRAVRGVAEGQTILDPAVASRVVGGRKGDAAAPGGEGSEGVERLSTRERQVLRLMVRGMSNRDIARELWISEPTVKTHVSHILQKLDAGDRVQAVVKALKLGLASVSDDGVVSGG